MTIIEHHMMTSKRESNPAEAGVPRRPWPGIEAAAVGLVVRGVPLILPDSPPS